jgi:3-dehydroquinate synthase
MHTVLKVKSKLSDYSVEFVDNLSFVENTIKQDESILIIDKNIAKLYPTLVKPGSILVECVEIYKSLAGVQSILDDLVERNANIRTKLIVVGGGILQDLAGFCASIYCRGIDYILVPTTLLAQVDSCVGGKTSLNYEGKKNILGTFYPPTNIIICPEFLQTLDKVDLLSGMGEIFKFQILQGKIDSFDHTNSEILKMIEDGLAYKIGILERDEFDKGERKFLNYGHTFGHALESISKNKIPHGIAVVVGCLIATKLAYKLGYNKNATQHDTIIAKGLDIIKASGIEMQSHWFNYDLLAPILKSDKKSTGSLTMVLVDTKPFLVIVDNISILKETLEELYDSI